MDMKIGCVLFLVVILTVVLVASTPVPKVAAAPYPIIYIKADGSIEPATAHITSFDNITYTFTADINASIVIEKNNTVVDGAGYTLQGPGSGTGIDLHDRNNVTLQNIEVTNFELGIWLSSSSYNTITGNIASNINNGIWLSSSSYNTITGNTASNSYTGINLFGSSYNNTIAGNTASNNSYGISSSLSSYNTITGNIASSNSEVGINLYASSNSNTITGNTISSNSEYGIWIYSSSNNVFFHNNLLDNANNVEVSSANSNVFDNGLEGNYWSNYTGVDVNQDGIGDTPHAIDANNTDHYPLMGMFHSFNTSLGKSINVISNSSVSGFTYESPGTIRFHVSNKTANQTHGFCRVSVPYEVLSDLFNVTIDGANPPYWNYTLYDNGTHQWIYFEYEHSTKEVVIIPEFPFFVILPMFMLVSLLIALSCKGKKRKVRLYN